MAYLELHSSVANVLFVNITSYRQAGIVKSNLNTKYSRQETYRNFGYVHNWN